ncbi:TatD family hydrolase, partial [Xanthomonas euvesicatoria]
MKAQWRERFAGIDRLYGVGTGAPRLMQLIDSHCHLDAGEFDHDRAAVIARARAAGVMQQV